MTNADNAVPETSSIFPQTILLQRSERRLSMPAGRSILDVVLAAQVHIRHACHIGHCGACEVKVLAGIPYHLDSTYGYMENPPGDRIRLCVSRALTPELVLDL